MMPSGQRAKCNQDDKEEGIIVNNVKTSVNRCWIPTIPVEKRHDLSLVKTPKSTNAIIQESLDRQSKRRRTQEAEDFLPQPK